MRILLLSSSSGSRGGGEPYLLHLAQGLSQLGNSVEIWTSSHSRMDEFAANVASQFAVRRIPYLNTYDRPTRSFGSILDLARRKSLRKEISQSGADIVHVNKQNLEDGLDLLLAASDSGIPVVCTIHITRSMAELGAFAGRFRDLLAVLALKSSRSQFIAISTTCSATLRRVLPWGSKVHTVVNGVPEAPSVERAGIRSYLGIQDDELLIGGVGRLETQKNPFFIIELLKRLPENYRAVWFGDGTLRVKLEKAIETEGLQDRFLVTGWKNNVRELLGGLDIFVQPSYFEGLSLALLEAVSAGLPVLSSDVEGVDDVIEHGRSGFVVPLVDLKGWAEVLLQLRDSSLRSQIGCAARASYIDKFSLLAMATSTEAVYRDILASRVAD